MSIRQTLIFGGITKMIRCKFKNRHNDSIMHMVFANSVCGANWQSEHAEEWLCVNVEYM